MNILLVNINPVVSRIISLCVRTDLYCLEEVESLTFAKLEKYDILFMDEDSYNLKNKDFLDRMTFSKTIFLLSKEHASETMEDFDETVHKPFLPSQITAHIEDFVDIEDEDDEEILNSPILDNSEIQRIKALLDEDENETLEFELDKYETRKVEVIKEHLEADGLEILNEDDMADILSSKAKKKKSKKKKQKKEAEDKKDTYTFEEALLAAVEGMKIKKIKKLLKGAEITIKINFKDDSDVD